MSPDELFKRPRKILALWAGVLVLFVGVLAGADYGLYAYVKHQDAHDYRQFLAKASADWDAPGFSAAESKTAIDRAVALAPKRPEPRVLLGHLHYRLRHWEEAIAAYEAAIARGSEDTGVRQNLVWCHIERGRHGEAARIGKESIASGHGSPVLDRYVGEAHYRAGQHAQARPYFEAALKAYPNDQHLMAKLLAVHQATGDDARAAEMAARISETEARIAALGGGGP